MKLIILNLCRFLVVYGEKMHPIDLDLCTFDGPKLVILDRSDFLWQW